MCAAVLLPLKACSAKCSMKPCKKQCRHRDSLQHAHQLHLLVVGRAMGSTESENAFDLHTPGPNPHQRIKAQRGQKLAFDDCFDMCGPALLSSCFQILTHHRRQEPEPKHAPWAILKPHQGSVAGVPAAFCTKTSSLGYNTGFLFQKLAMPKTCACIQHSHIDIDVVIAYLGSAPCQVKMLT